MLQNFPRLLWLFPILCLSLSVLAYGQSSAQNDERGKNSNNTKSVTGCLQKGAEPGGFTVTGEDGKVWELRSRKVDLADHVGHKVTVTGAVTHESKAHEEKMAASEQKEAGEKEHADLRVSRLTMVSKSCE